jgi:hypothetical protein
MARTMRLLREACADRVQADPGDVARAVICFNGMPAVE